VVQAAQEEKPEEQDEEAARRRTIADRMAKLGGIRFGAAPPMPQRAARPSNPNEEESHPDEAEAGEKPELTEEEEERARKERIAAKLAGMGGMRIGMMPPSFPTRKPPTVQKEVEEADVPKSPPPPARAPPSRPPPPPQASKDKDSGSDYESATTSDDGVKVEAEESEIEEVDYEDAQPEPEPAPPPPPPARGVRQARRQSTDLTNPGSPPPPAGRPPVPAGLPPRRMSGQTAPTPRRPSGEAPAPEKAPFNRGQSDYVMVEEPETEEAPPPLPSNRPGARAPPPSRAPPPPQAEKDDSISSQWELPTIPSSNLNFGNDDLSTSWTEADSAAPLSESIMLVPSPNEANLTPRVETAAPRVKLPSELLLSADDLMAMWGRVGVQVCEVAMTLFERSKKGLIGDGTYPGFVRAVLHEVPNASSGDEWGYLVYKQSAASVQKRASDIMPGDIIEILDGKFKGHKGIHAYHQNVGAQEPLVGVVSEVETKKSKIRVFQANQNVGQQVSLGFFVFPEQRLTLPL
jgi:myosin tail region-interacting protein MTI1